MATKLTKKKLIGRRVFHVLYGAGTASKSRWTAGLHLVHDVAFDDGHIRVVLASQLRAEVVGDISRTEAASILGVNVGATDAEVKTAYRAQAMTTHPDHGGNAAAFCRVQSAYEALSTM
jgi:DnaJ-domain-containing protein 1